MKPWIKRLANKSFLLCLLSVLLLTFLLHSVERLTLSKEFALGEKEIQESRVESAITPENILGLLDNISFKEDTNTVENVKHNRAPFTVRQHSEIKVNLDDKDGEKAKVKPHVTTLKFTEETKETSMPYPLEEAQRKQRKVLLLSSVGRSGSSFLGLLLAALGNNMYFFEPIRVLPRKYQNKENNTQELSRYFQCTINPNLKKWGSKISINIVHPFTRDKRWGQVPVQTLMKYCRDEPLIIIKVIRMRLQWVRELMGQKEYDDLKVIHLVRDPRGSFLSMNKLSWNLTTENMCAKIYQDLQERENIVSLYPSRYIFVKYEDLCQDPYGEARRLMRFLNDQGNERPNVGNKTGFVYSPPVEKDKARLLDPAMYQDLPKGILDYLNDHMHINSKHRFGPFTVERETSVMYQRWRWTISQRQLQNVENACGNVIKTLGHRIFSNFADVRNSSLSLFVNKPS